MADTGADFDGSPWPQAPARDESGKFRSKPEGIVAI